MPRPTEARIDTHANNGRGEVKNLPPATPRLHIDLKVLDGINFSYAGDDEQLERALQIQESSVGRVLSDFTQGGFEITIPSLASRDPESRNRITSLFELANIPLVLPDDDTSLNGHNGNGANGNGNGNGHRPMRIRTQEDLRGLVETSVYVEDKTRVVLDASDTKVYPRVITTPEGKTKAVLVSGQRPNSDQFGKHIVVAQPDGHTDKVIVYTNGQISAAHDASDGRVAIQVNKSVYEAVSSEAKKTVKLPDIERGITNLDQEVEFLKDMRKYRLRSYEAPTGPVHDSIVRILEQHHEQSVPLTKDDVHELARKITPFIKDGIPVPVSLTFALTLRAPNSLKYKEGENLPTYGWLHFIDFMATVNEKVKRVYPPGIKIFMFEEGTLFGERLGVSKESVAKNMEFNRRAIQKLDAPIELIPLVPEDFPDKEVERTNIPLVDDTQIYALVCSRPDVTDPSVFQYLYEENSRQNRNWSEIKQKVGPIWNAAHETSKYIRRALQYRKSSKLFERLIKREDPRYAKHDNPIAIDATVTDKEGRIVFDVTTTLFKHGMTVVRRNTNGEHKVVIVPEYRIPRLFPKAKGVSISRDQLDGGKGAATFYYIEQ